MWITYIPMLLTAAISLTGLVLLIRGFYGQVVYHDPLCRKCRYNLTGLTSERCPECGSLVAKVGVVMGRRRRRRRLIVAGLVLLMPSAAILIGAQTQWARSVNWYQKLPTWWVLHDAESATENRALRAFEELDRRDRLGLLTAEDRQAHADAMLVQFTRRSSPFESSTKVEDVVARWLDTALEKGLLTSAQRTQVYDRLAWVTWRARPVASLEVGIPIELRVADYGYGLDDLPVELIAEQVSMSIDGGEPVILLNKRRPLGFTMQEGDFDLPEPFRESRDMGVGAAWSGWAPPTLAWNYGHLWTVTASRPGVYEFRLTYTYSVFAPDPGPSTPSRAPLYQQTRTVVARSQVVAIPPGQLIRTVQDSQVSQDMLARIAVESVFRDRCFDPKPETRGKRKEDRNEDAESPCISVNIHASGPLPVGMAFHMTVEGAGERADLFDENDYEEYIIPRIEKEIVTSESVTSRVCPNWSGQETWWLAFWDDQPDRKTVNIVLTPDVRLAARSVDVTTICGETLRLEDVPVDTDQQAAYLRDHDKRSGETAKQEAAAGSLIDSETSQPAK